MRRARDVSIPSSFTRVWSSPPPALESSEYKLLRLEHDKELLAIRYSSTMSCKILHGCWSKLYQPSFLHTHTC